MSERESAMSEREDSARDRDEAARARDESARLRDEKSRDRDEAAERKVAARAVRTRFEGRLFVFQIVANVVVLGALLILMMIATIRISDINQRQLDSVQLQNSAQICAQADIVGAVKQIGRSLGLPVQDIVPPDTTGLECP
jgi:hypothetical protein